MTVVDAGFIGLVVIIIFWILGGAARDGIDRDKQLSERIDALDIEVAKLRLRIDQERT